MKLFNYLFITAAIIMTTVTATAQTKNAGTNQDTGSKNKKLYIDVHHLEPGKISFADVAGAHAKDLAVQKKHGVEFIKYWVDTAKGDVYCLSSSASEEAIQKTHAAAHGLLPDKVYLVTDGPEAKIKDGKNLFLDIHELGAGKVTAAAVAEAHQKDLAVQNKYGVSFINYWVNEKEGVVMCLSQAASSSYVIATHKEAHGLIPVQVLKVKQGQ